MSIRFVNPNGKRIEPKQVSEIKELIEQTGVPAFKVYYMPKMSNTSKQIFGFIAVEVKVRATPGEMRYATRVINGEECPVELVPDKNGRRSGWIYDDPEGINRKKFVFQRALREIDLAKTDPLYPVIEKLAVTMGVKNMVLEGRIEKRDETAEDIDKQMAELAERKKKMTEKASEAKVDRPGRVLRKPAPSQVEPGVTVHEG